MRRVIIGLLGPVASGKSHVAGRLAVLGPARVVDADALAREALDAAAADGRLAARFGPEALRQGRADRDLLRARAHADPAARTALEALTHPYVRERIAAAVAAHRRGEGPPVLVLDVALLLEAGLDRSCDELWYVQVPERVRRARALARGVSAADLERWAAAQAPDADRRARAHVVVKNDLPPAELDAQLADALSARAAR